MYQGREKQLRDQVVALEARVTQLQADAAKLEPSHRSPVYLSMSRNWTVESKSSQPKTPRRIIFTPDRVAYGTDIDSLIRNDPVVSDAILVAAWKRVADENEGTREKTPAGRDQAEDSAVRPWVRIKAADSPANVCAVPKIFP